MRRSANSSGLTPALTILALSAILLLCIREAHAEEGGPEVRVYHAREKAEQSANDLKLRARGGETVDLKAELFAPESEESPELQPRNSRVNEFRWVVSCAARARSQGCKEEELVPEGEALRYKVPATLHDADVEIVVSHGTESAKGALVTIQAGIERPAPGEPGVASADNKKKGEKDRPAVPGQNPKDKDQKEKTRTASPAPESPAKRNGPKSEKFGPSMRSKGDGDTSSGDSSSGSSSSSSSASRKSKSKKSGNDDWSSGRGSFGGGYDDFSYGFGGGGGGGGAKTNARGFNRGEGTTTVVSCTHQYGATGHGRLVCEDPSKKVLRVRAPRGNEQPQKTAKQFPAKTQAAPVKAPPKAQSAPARQTPAPRPAKAAPVAQKRLPSEASLQKNH